MTRGERAGDVRGTEPIAASGSAVIARKRSDSEEQRRAEPIILALLARELGVELAPKALDLPGGARVEVDGVSRDEAVLVEVFAHQGRLRGGQFHKVARDALKLITLARERSGARMIIAFADNGAADCVRGKSWLAEALRAWSVEVCVVALDDVIKDEIRAAQTRQVMVNRGHEVTGAAGTG